jgi:UDP:flavonoid glycosyltransferase YjiC (YdhE family)
MFGEQQYDLENLARKGCGIVLSRYNLSSVTLNQSINEILSDKAFKENISKVQTQILKYKTNENYYPPMIGTKQIINFLDNAVTSYFKVKGL